MNIWKMLITKKENVLKPTGNLEGGSSFPITKTVGNVDIILQLLNGHRLEIVTS